MKTVWVIETGSYSDYRVRGAYSTKEKAELVASKIKDGLYSDEKPTITEWKMDPNVDEINVGMHRWCVSILYDGTVTHTQEGDEEDFAGDEFDEDFIFWDKPPKLRLTVWARDEKHAIKIANEFRTMKIANGDWITERQAHE